MVSRFWPWLVLSLIGLGQILLVFPQLISPYVGGYQVLDTPEIFLEADELINRGRLDEAETLLRAIPEGDSKAPQGLWRLAQLNLYLKGSEREGRQALQDILNKYPDSEEAIWAEEIFLENWEVEPAFFVKASQGYQKLAAKNYEHAKAPYWLLKSAQVKMKTDDLPGALADLSRIIEKYPHWENIDQVYNEQGHLYLSLGEPLKAVDNFKALLAKAPPEPLNGEIKLSLAKSYEDSGDYPEAREIYQQLAKNKDHAEIVEKRLELLEIRIKGQKQNIPKVDYGYRPARETE